jgi:hypothetical protein
LIPHIGSGLTRAPRIHAASIVVTGRD